MWAIKPENRRALTVVPFVLLGHLLLIWMLIQNRWIVMSPATVTFMPPIMASIVLTQSAADRDSNADATGPWGRQSKGRGDRDLDLDLKPSKAISLGVPRVQRSVPWLITELLPDLRGNSADLKADQQEHVDSVSDTDGSTTIRKPKVKLRRISVKAAQPAELVLTIPAPSQMALIPPPQAQNDWPLTPAPQASPPSPEVRPAQMPSIPDPAPMGQREIPPLWAPNPVPPPKLALIPPAPPVLKSIPVTPPLNAPSELPISAAPLPTVVPRAVPMPTSTPELAQTPRPAAKTAPRPESTPTLLPSAMPLVLTPAPVLPQAVAIPPQTLPAMMVPTQPAVVTAAPSAQVSAPAVTPVPIVSANDPIPPQVSSGAVVNAPAPTVTTDSVATRNPMLVEVPRYRMAEPAPRGGTGLGNSGNASSNQSDANGGNRAGLDGVGSKSGSLLGLGVAAPVPLPTASATGGGAKSLNLSLPRVEVYRSGIGPVRQPSFSDLANAQLRRGAAKDPMAEAVTNSENPDCLKDSGMGLLGAPVAAYKAMTGKCRQ